VSLSFEIYLNPFPIILCPHIFGPTVDFSDGMQHALCLVSSARHRNKTQLTQYYKKLCHYQTC